MSFKPYPDRGRWYGLAVVLALGLLDIFLVSQLLGRPVDGLSFVLAVTVLGSLVVMGYLAYRTFGAWTLEYWVDRNAVTLVWGAARQIVPLSRIQRILAATPAAPSAATSGRPAGIWHWPCPERRRYPVAGIGMVNAYATRPLAEQIILVTDEESFGLSPIDAPGLMQALQQRHALGPARLASMELRRPPVWTWALWRDRGALFLMAAGLLGVLVMFGVLCFRFPYLSSDLPLHFDVTGRPDRIAEKSGLFALPLIGLVTWLFNTAAGIWLYRHVQRGAAYLLWGGALVVQAVAALALFNLMRW